MIARPHVVIIGGGFGGLTAARALRRAPVDITLLDRRNHHLFQPLLYQVATAALNPSDIAYPIRSILRKQKNVQVLLADAQAIDLQAKNVHIRNGELAYDYLIIATGATHSYFGNQQWAQHAPGLKTIEDALDIRRRIYLAYEAAEREQNPQKRREWLTFAVVGAGPTGVELAGALCEIGHHTLTKDFRSINPRHVRVVLVEGKDRVLPPYPPKLSEKARQQLVHLGVEVRTSEMVTAIEKQGIVLGTERINARTILWAAGVRGSSLAKSLGVPLDGAGRVLVDQNLCIPGYSEAFVIGDLASVEMDGTPVPGVAQAAVQGGKHAAQAIRATIAGKNRKPFVYRDRGSMATVGRAAAVANIAKLQLSGFVAWMIWLAVHILVLIGFRNRFLVLFSWAWSYLTFQRGARLITGKVEQLPTIHKGSTPTPICPTPAGTVHYWERLSNKNT